MNARQTGPLSGLLVVALEQAVALAPEEARWWYHLARVRAQLGELQSALEDVAFQTRPLYTGEPWFLAPSLFVYQMRDKLNL